MSSRTKQGRVVDVFQPSAAAVTICRRRSRIEKCVIVSVPHAV